MLFGILRQSDQLADADGFNFAFRRKPAALLEKSRQAGFKIVAAFSLDEFLPMLARHQRFA